MFAPSRARGPTTHWPHAARRPPATVNVKRKKFRDWRALSKSCAYCSGGSIAFHVYPSVRIQFLRTVWIGWMSYRKWKTGPMGRPGKCSPFSPLFHFQCDIYPIDHTVMPRRDVHSGRGERDLGAVVPVPLCCLTHYHSSPRSLQLVLINNLTLSFTTIPPEEGERASEGGRIKLRT